MKTIELFLEHLKSNPIYSGDFSGRESVFDNFSKSEDPDITILYADYDCPPYEGYAGVVYFRESTGKYYEAYGSHCSCYGLEGQWDGDEELLPKELFNRLGALQGAYEAWKDNQ